MQEDEEEGQEGEEGKWEALDTVNHWAMCDNPLEREQKFQLGKYLQILQWVCACFLMN